MSALAPDLRSVQSIDIHARDLSPTVRATVYGGTKATSEKRYSVLGRDYADSDALRRTAGQIKQHTLEHLDDFLAQAEASLKANGAHVHFATTGDRANEICAEVLKHYGAKLLVKSKSMVTEETELVPYLESQGITCVETDLGEYIVQIDHDHPSHIVKPITHKNRFEVAEIFAREGLGDFRKTAPEDIPAAITHTARGILRDRYFEAEAGLTGANFVSAESGRIVLVTNEGNSRFTIAANRVLIAMVGIEKLVPTDRDLGLLLNLIGRSGTGQQLTVYTEFFNGPKLATQPDGPEHLHVIFVDNRRTEVLASDCSEILRCIRCGACLNVCPIYRQSSGHAYRSVYPGPVGAVLSPLLAGPKFSELADLPKASSLCGACNEVCPVDIPIPDLLLRLRDKAKREKAPAATRGTPSMAPWRLLATQPAAWKAAMTLGAAANVFPPELIPIPAIQAWVQPRKLPKWKGGAFRQWFRQHQKAARKHQLNG